MKNKKNGKLHFVTILAFMLLIVLGIGSASAPPAQWKDVSYKGEEEKLLTESIWSYSDGWSSSPIPIRIEFHPNGKLVGFDSSTIAPATGRRLTLSSNSTWERNGVNFQFVTANGRSHGEGILNNEKNRISGKLTSSSGEETEFTIIFVRNSLQGGTDFDFRVSMNTDNTLTITGYRATVKDVIIPATLGGFDVTIIKEYAFYDTGINSVVIPNKVKIIEEAAFLNNNLTSVTFQSSIPRYSIEYSSFPGDLVNIYLDENNSAVGRYTSSADRNGRLRWTRQR